MIDLSDLYYDVKKGWNITPEMLKNQFFGIPELNGPLFLSKSFIWSGSVGYVKKKIIGFHSCPVPADPYFHRTKSNLWL